MDKKEKIQRDSKRFAEHFKSIGLNVDEKYLAVCIRDAVYNSMPKSEAEKIFHGGND